MKASRAPGPVQSYSVLHNQKNVAGGAGGRQRPPPASTGKKSAASNAKSAASNADNKQGVLKQFIDLDAIPDFPDGNGGWGDNSPAPAPAPPAFHKGVTTAPASLAQQRCNPTAYQADSGLHRHQPAAQPYTAPYNSHVSPRGHHNYQHSNDDNSDEEYEDLGYGQNHNRNTNKTYQQQELRYYQSPPIQTEYTMESQTQYDDMVDEVDNIQAYSSPRKNEGKKAATTFIQKQSQNKVQPASTVVSMQKQPPLTISVTEGRSVTPTNAIRRTPKADVPAKKQAGGSSSSPKYSQPANFKPPPPLPCEQAYNDGDVSPSTVSGGSPKNPLYFSKQPRQVEYKPYTLKQYNLIKPKEYVEISKIQPDLNTDELVAKRKNLERIKEFSKQLRNVNKDTISQQRKLPSASEQSDLEKAKHKYSSARQRAIEFSKRIPKPGGSGEQDSQFDLDGEDDDLKDTRVSLSAGHEPSNNRKTRKQNELPKSSVYTDEDNEAAARLLELEARHQQSKAQVEALRKALAGTSLVK